MFRDRKEAGERLAEKLEQYAGRSIVLAIPRGGMPVAYEVARKLLVPFSVIVVRKIPIPWEPEAGFGAVTDDGTVVLNDRLTSTLRLSPQQINAAVAGAKREIDRRRLLYLGKRQIPSLKNKTAILIDDGLASGFTMIAAVNSVRKQNAEKVVVASPVASRSAFDRVNKVADEVVCLLISDASTFAVASFYENWYDLTDEEVLEILQKRGNYPEGSEISDEYTRERDRNKEVAE